MSLPLVSIMMPAFNVENYIEEAILSCQKQTYENWELCIVDDGSEDSTYEVAFSLSLKDSRIRVQQQPHLGCPSARNLCLEMCNGDLIARQDADDLQSHQRLEKQVSFLLNNSYYDIVTTKMKWLKNGELIPKPASSMKVEKYLKGISDGPVCASIVAWSYVYKKVGNYSTDLLAGSDGHWNFRAILEEMSWGFIDEFLYIYRRHSKQITKRLSKQQRQNHEASRKKYLNLWLLKQ